MSIKVENIMRPLGGKGFAAVSFKTLEDQMKMRYKEFVESTIEVSAMKNKDTYLLWFVIPSKENKEYPGDVIYYDVLLEFTPPNTAWKLRDNIREYDVRVFNNNPRFQFTFTYAYNKHKALINLPSKFYNKHAIKEAPKQRNPQLLLGLDENLYHSIMYMEKHHLFDKETLDTLCLSSTFTMKEIITEVSTQDAKMTEVTDRDLRHRASARHKNSKVWEQGSDKAKIKQQLLQESKNLAELRAKNPKESQILKTQMLANLRSRLSLSNIRKPSITTSSLNANNLKQEPKKKAGNLRSNLRSNLKSSL